MPTLIIDIEGTRKHFTVELPTVSIGRGVENDIRIRDIGASRRHCEILLHDGAYWIADLQSENGTFLNGVKITEQRLRSGDTIQIGETPIVFEETVVDLESTSRIARVLSRKPDGETRRTPPRPSTTRAVRKLSGEDALAGGSTRRVSKTARALRATTRSVPRLSKSERYAMEAGKKSRPWLRLGVAALVVAGIAAVIVMTLLRPPPIKRFQAEYTPVRAAADKAYNQGGSRKDFERAKTLYLKALGVREDWDDLQKARTEASSVRQRIGDCDWKLDRVEKLDRELAKFAAAFEEEYGRFKEDPFLCLRPDHRGWRYFLQWMEKAKQDYSAPPGRSTRRGRRWPRNGSGKSRR